MKCHSSTSTIAFAAALLACTGRHTFAHDTVLHWTSFAEIDIRSPEIRGTLWFDFDGFQSQVHLDRDGDTVLSPDERAYARGFVERFVNAELQFLWQGRIHPAQVYDVDSASRPIDRGRYARVTFGVKDCPPGEHVTIVSRLLADVAPDARCMARITVNDRAEVFVLDARHYFTTHPSRAAIPADSPYRPPEQRGRVVAVGDACIEMLYARPAGAFYLYVLKSDRYTPHPVAARPLTATIRPGGSGEPREVALRPDPLKPDPKDRCSRFTAKVDVPGAEAFNVDMALPFLPDAPRVVFEAPAVKILPPEKLADADRRYACPQLCLGVQDESPSRPCPRCGARLVRARGGPIAGVGIVGRLGGRLATLRASDDGWIEVLLASPEQLRVYRTNRRLAALPVAVLSGSVHFSTDEHFAQTEVEIVLEPSEDGDYLAALVPPTVRLPIRARCVMDFHDQAGPAVAEFLIEEITPPPP